MRSSGLMRRGGEVVDVVGEEAGEEAAGLMRRLGVGEEGGIRRLGAGLWGMPLGVRGRLLE